MDGIVFTQFPDICTDEIKRLIKKDSELTPSGCKIKDISAKELAFLTIRLQSASRVGIHLCQSKEVKVFEIPKDVKPLLKEVNSFAVSAIKNSSNPIPSPDLAAEWGGVIKDMISLDVNLTNPDLKIFVSVNEDSYEIIIDLAGFDLTKRPYKLFNNPTALNGAVAFALCQYSEVDKNTSVLDPFCGSGVICIEAALFQQDLSCFIFEDRFSGLKLPFTKSVFEEAISTEREKSDQSKDIRLYGFDEQLRIILGARKNAKIAGTIDYVTFSKASIDWIDSKFEEGVIDCIITQAPEDGKRQLKKKRSKDILDELFYQAKYILKNKGTLNLLQRKREPSVSIAEKHSFKLLEEKVIFQGKQEFTFLRFSKQQN